MHLLQFGIRVNEETFILSLSFFFFFLFPPRAGQNNSVSKTKVQAESFRLNSGTILLFVI